MNPMLKSTSRRRGSSMVEFTLVGIPVMFVLISIFEISRGMWMYHTMAYAVKQGVRMAIVHGINCHNTSFNPNNCSTNIAAITAVIQQAAVGVDATKTTLTFTTTGGSTTCKMGGSGSTDCPQLTNEWPPYDDAGTQDGVGKPIRIDINTPFNSAIAMLFPGSAGQVFGSFGNLGASSTDYIQY
jgi:hypothetical protein